MTPADAVETIAAGPARAAAPPLLRPAYLLADAAGLAEGWLAVLAAASFGLVGLGSVVAPFVPGQSLWTRAAFAAVGCCWLALDLPYTARLLLIAIRQRRPFTLRAAVGQRLWPAGMRVVPVAWWAAHFAVAGTASIGMHAVALHNGRHGRADAGTAVIGVVMAIACGLAANGYLMLCVCAITPSVRVRRAVWRWRLMIDLTFVLAAMTIAWAARSTR